MIYKTYNRLYFRGKVVSKPFLNFNKLRAKNLKEARRKANVDARKFNKSERKRRHSLYSIKVVRVVKRK